MTASHAARGEHARDLLGSWRNRRVRLAVVLLALGYLALRWYLLLVSDDPILAADAYTYWSAPYSDPYAGPQLGLPGAYLYSPAFLQLIAPLRLLPWEAFHALWAAIGFGALILLVGPAGAALAITILPFVYRDLLVGNIHLMLAAAIVIGLRFSAVWAFPILTKLTPGVGLAYHAARREWRAAGVAIGVSVVISAVSFALAPELWGAWVERLRGDTGTAGGPYLAILVVRVMVGAALAAYAGWRRRPWLIPVAVVVALPILWPDSLAILLACFPLFATTRDRVRTPAA